MAKVFQCADPDHRATPARMLRRQLNGARDGTNVGFPGDICTCCYNRRYSALRRARGYRRPSRAGTLKPADVETVAELPQRLPAPALEPFTVRRSFAAMTAAEASDVIRSVWDTPVAARILTHESETFAVDPGDMPDDEDDD